VVATASLASCRAPAVAPRPPHLLFVSIDTLRADHVGACGYPRSTTPFLDTLAARGQLLCNVLVPLPATGPSHASYLTSLHPLQHSVLANAMVLPESAATLAELLQARGYFTMGAVGVFHLGGGYGFGQGFDVFSDSWEARPPLDTPRRRGAPSVNDEVFRMLDAYRRQRGGQPLFLFVHYFDIHSPYQVHPGYEVPEPVSLPASVKSHRRPLAGIIERYDHGIRFVDEHIARLHGRLEELGLSDNLLVAVVSDHGEQLGEHGHRASHADIYRETVRVPVILQGPGIPPGRVDAPASSMDVPATLMRRLGIPVPPLMEGRPLPGLGSTEGEARARTHLVLGYPAYTRSIAAVRDGRWLIRNFDHLYRTMTIEPAPEAPSSRRAGLVEAIPLQSDEASARYSLPLPPPHLVPVRVTAEVRLARAGCRAEIELAAEPALAYLSEPLRVRGGVRLAFQAVSGDALTLSVRPADCAGAVHYGVSDRLEPSRDSPGATTRETDLWRSLLAVRKLEAGDELYRTEEDPDMLRSLATRPEEHQEEVALAKASEREWDRLSASALKDARWRRHSPEETEALRSLGYLR
jgi:arylsulfatase A-like enzyme